MHLTQSSVDSVPPRREPVDWSNRTMDISQTEIQREQQWKSSWYHLMIVPHQSASLGHSVSQCLTGHFFPFPPMPEYNCRKQELTALNRNSGSISFNQKRLEDTQYRSCLLMSAKARNKAYNFLAPTQKKWGGIYMNILYFILITYILNHTKILLSKRPLPVLRPFQLWP